MAHYLQIYTIEDHYFDRKLNMTDIVPDHHLLSSRVTGDCWCVIFFVFRYFCIYTFLYLLNILVLLFYCSASQTSCDNTMYIQLVLLCVLKEG